MAGGGVLGGIATHAWAMAAELGGPFSAFQQARAHLPDGRRVSNWYLITPAGGQVCLNVPQGSCVMDSVALQHVHAW